MIKAFHNLRVSNPNFNVSSEKKLPSSHFGHFSDQKLILGLNNSHSGEDNDIVLATSGNWELKKEK